MYKSELRNVLSSLEVNSAGPVAALLGMVEEAEAKIEAALIDAATNNDARVREAATKLQDALHPLLTWLQTVAPSQVVVELHQLMGRFETAILQHPSMGPLLRPGLLAVKELIHAYDAALKKQKAPAVAQLVRPGASLATSYLQYAALKDLFSKPGPAHHAGEACATIEIDGMRRLSVFADYVMLLALLAEAARAATSKNSDHPSAWEDEVWISSIESGSPVKFSIFGGGKSIPLLLAMVKDIAKSSYQHFTYHGSTIQSIETYAKARELGVDDPTVLNNLVAAMRSTSEKYRASLQDGQVVIKIDGISVPGAPVEPPLLTPSSLPKLEQIDSMRQLSPPGAEDESKDKPG